MHFYNTYNIYNIIDIENTKQNICLRNKMVKDYLEKIRQEYIEHKVSLEEQISLYENKEQRQRYAARAQNTVE